MVCVLQTFSMGHSAPSSTCELPATQSGQVWVGVQVCKEGARLTVHQAALLRHFGIQMATARLRLKAALRGDAADVVVFEVSDLEASDDDGDVEQFDDGLPSKMMLPEVLPQR